MCHPEVIRQQMEETRTALAEKLETLEHQVVDTVAGANTAVTETVATVKDAVQETVEVVKGSVQETAESVRKALDLPRQMDRHPWLFLGGSVALGYFSGWLAQRAACAAERAAARGEFVSLRGRRAGPETDGQQEYLRREWPQEVPAMETPRKEGPSWINSIGKEFSQEIDKVKSLAIGYGAGVIRDLIAQSAPPQLRPRLSEVMDNLTVKLGGETIQGPLVQPTAETEPRREDFAEGPTGMGRTVGSRYT